MLSHLYPSYAVISFLRGATITTQNFTFENPEFYTYYSVSRVSLCRSIINICSQSVQGHPPLSVPFRPRNLRTTKSSTYLYLYTQSSRSHCILNGSFLLCLCLLNTASLSEFQFAAFQHPHPFCQ